MCLDDNSYGCLDESRLTIVAEMWRSSARVGSAGNVGNMKDILSDMNSANAQNPTHHILTSLMPMEK